MAVFRGTGRDDTITGSSGDDNFLLWQGGSDTVDGGGGNDIFRMGAALNAGDKIDGGTGEDVITLIGDYSAGLVFNADTITNIEVMGLAGGHSYNFTLNDGNVAADQRLLVKAQALGAGDHLTFDGSAETDGNYYIIAGAGNDSLTGGAKHDVFDLSHGGNDTAHGGGGNNTFLLGSTLTAADQIDGGTGDDTLELNGTYNFTFGATTFTDIDTLKLDAGHNYRFVSNDGNVASGATITVDASALLSGNQVTFHGEAETDGSFHFEAGAGSNYFTGGAGNNVFDLTRGTNIGTSTLAGDGDDVFNVGAAFDSYGTGIDGGSGLNGGAGHDTLNIYGDYPGTIELVQDPGELTSIETVTFGAGHSYDVELIQDIAGGATLTLDGSALGAGDALNINLFDGTSSAYAITGGAGGDTFDFSNFSTSDAIDGGAGNDTVSIKTDGTFTFTPTTLTDVEGLFVNSFNIHISTNDATVASGTAMTVDFLAVSNLGATIEFDGSAETDGHFNITGPTHASDYNVTGGALSDTFTLGNDGTGSNAINGGGGDDTLTAGISVAIQFNGGSGNDTLALTGGGTVASSQYFLTSVESLTFDDHNWNVATGDTMVQSGTTLTVDASALTSAHSLTFDGSGETDGSFAITGGAGNDTITGGTAANTITAGLGADSIACGAGADTIVTGAVADSTGAGGYDTIDDFNFDADKFNLAGAHTVTNIHGTSAFVDSTTFDANLTAASVGHLSDDGVLIVSATTGNLSGHIFIVVDVNNDGLYQAGADYVFDVSTAFGTIDTADFI